MLVTVKDKPRVGRKPWEPYRPSLGTWIIMKEVCVSLNSTGIEKAGWRDTKGSWLKGKAKMAAQMRVAKVELNKRRMCAVNGREEPWQSAFITSHVAAVKVFARSAIFLIDYLGCLHIVAIIQIFPCFVTKAHLFFPGVFLVFFYIFSLSPFLVLWLAVPV